METIALLKEAFQNETLPDSTICRWHKAFMNSWESAEVQHIGGRLRTVVTDFNINSVKGDWRGSSFIHLKAGRWPTYPRNVNKAHFNKVVRNETCLLNLSSPCWGNGASSFSVSGTNLPRSRLLLSCHHCWWILDF